MTNIITGNFGKPDTNLYSAPKPYSETPQVIPTVQEQAYVKVRADIFHEMLDTIAFYAAQKFDHGKRANVLLNTMASKE